MKNRYKNVYAIINNKLEKLYVSHEDRIFNGETYDITLITGLPNEKISRDHLQYKKSNKKSPRLYIDKTTILL